MLTPLGAPVAGMGGQRVFHNRRKNHCGTMGCSVLSLAGCSRRARYRNFFAHTHQEGAKFVNDLSPQHLNTGSQKFSTPHVRVPLRKPGAVREVLRVWTCLRRVRMRRKSSQDCGVENRGQPFDWRGPNRVATLQMGSIVRDQKVGRAHSPPQGECENLLCGFKMTTLRDKGKQKGSRKNLRWK